MFNYEDAKKFFYDKLTDDLVGKGRMESALYHTAVMIYHKGVEDGRDSTNNINLYRNVVGVEK